MQHDNQTSNDASLCLSSLLVDLQNIQLYVSSNNKDKKLNFDFKDFIKKCMNVLLADASFIYDHLNETLENIKKDCTIKEQKNWFIYENLYAQVQIVFNVFKSIKEEIGDLNPQYSNTKILNKNLLKVQNLEKPLLKLHLLCKLIEGNFFCPSLPYLLYNEDMIDLLKLVYESLQNPDNSQFNTFISKLNENYELIPEISKIFPFHLFKDKEHPFYMILYWIPLLNDLYEHKITFHIECNQTYDFVFLTNYSGIEPLYIFKEEKSLNLSVGSKIFLPKINKTLKIPPNKPLNVWSKIFYGLSSFIIKNESEENIFQKAKNMNIVKKFIKSLPNKKTNQFTNLFRLYQNNPNNCPFISKAWPIIFTFSPEIVNILIVFFNPLEYDIIRTISEIYFSIDIYQLDRVLEFVKWISQIDQLSKLNLIINNQ